MVHDGSEHEVGGALGAWPPARQGMYDPMHEHDECGLGFIAHIKGKKSHAIISQGLRILENLSHRGATGADPSVLLAFTVPLMFGYMFGDVGQGLVIAAAGHALRRRFALAPLFVAGGLSAAFFGLLFGSVFSLHVLHAWWVQPLDDPLQVLLVWSRRNFGPAPTGAHKRPQSHHRSRG